MGFAERRYLYLEPIRDPRRLLALRVRISLVYE
jgi:hypothetical protein